MTYRVEYNGSDVEVTTLDSAIEGAKQAIAADVGPVSEWSVEHDETINDWFVQGIANGSRVGSTAVVTGPEPVAAPPQPVAPQHDGPGVYRARHPVGSPDHGWLRSVSFTGVTPVEAFGKATAWLAGRPDLVEVSDVGWHASPGAGECELRIHYHGPAD